MTNPLIRERLEAALEVLTDVSNNPAGSYRSIQDMTKEEIETIQAAISFLLQKEVYKEVMQGMISAMTGDKK